MDERKGGGSVKTQKPLQTIAKETLLIILSAIFFIVSAYTVIGACTTPTENLNINSNTVLCNGTYYLDDVGVDGAIRITDNDVNLTCNNTVLIGSSLSSSKGIYTSQTKNVIINQCIISNYSRGIELRYVRSSYLLKNNITNTSYAGIYIYNSNHSTLQENYFDKNLLGTSSGMLIHYGLNITVKNNIFENNYRHLLIEYSNSLFTITDNTFINATGYQGFDLRSLNNSIIRNNLFKNHTQTGEPLAFLNSDIKNVSVINNTFINNRGAIRIYYSGEGNYFYHNMFINNTLPTLFGTFSGVSAQVATSARAEYNHFNTTIGGVAQGNYWSDIAQKMLNIKSLNGDIFGDSGTDYPYNLTNGGNVSENVTDWGPMFLDDMDGDGDPAPNDCNDNDPNVLSPRDDLVVDRSITLCPGNYTLDDTGFDGLLQVYGVKNIQLVCNGTRIESPTLFSGLAISVQYTSNVTVDNCTILSYAGGISVYDTNSSSFSGNKLYNNSDYSFYLQRTNDTYFQNNLIVNNGYSGFYITNANYTHILDSNFTSGYYGIFLQSNVFYLNILNNNFINHTQRGILHTVGPSQNIMIQKNTFFNTSKQAIDIFYTGGAAVISGWNMTNNTFLNNGGAIRIGPYSGNYIYYNNFTNNSRLDSSSKSGEVIIVSGTNHFNITVAGKAQGNFWYDIAPKALDIRSADRDIFGDSGTKYPYNSTNGGNVSLNVQDWGPMLLGDSDGDGDPDYNDCAQNNSAVMSPRNDLYITQSTTLCNGTYEINDAGSTGVVILSGTSNKILTCNNTIIKSVGSAGTGITVTSSTNSTVQNCTVQSYSTNIWMVSSARSIIRNNNLINQTVVGLLVSASDHSAVNNNIVSRSTGGARGIEVQFSKNVSIINNTLLSLPYGMSIHDNSTKLLIANNIFSNNSARHIRIYATAFGGTAENTSNETVIRNNIFNATSTCPIAIKFETAKGVNVSNNTFINNCGALNFDENSTNNLVYHNNFINNTRRYSAEMSAQVVSKTDQNHFNITSSGVARGNYWDDIRTTPLHIYGWSGGGGSSNRGPDYPYSSTNGGNVSGNVTDWGPLLIDNDDDGDPEWFDCNDDDIYTFSPSNDLYLGGVVNKTYSFCNGTYTIEDTGFSGVVQIGYSQNLTIRCNNTVIKSQSISGTGLYAHDSEDVKIYNCTIMDYMDCISFSLTRRDIVSNSTFVNCTLGVNIYASNDTIITQNNFLNNSGQQYGWAYGAYLHSSSMYKTSRNNTISQNRFDRNYNAIYASVYQAEINIIENIFTNHSSYMIYLDGSDDGGNTSNRTRIHKNIFANNSHTAIYFQQVRGANITNNTFYNNKGAIHFDVNTRDNHVHYNNFTDNSVFNPATSFSGQARSENPNNSFNTTVGGVAQGNYWSDIATSGLQIYDLNFDGFGDFGPHYPYNLSKGASVSANVTDWGPFIYNSDDDGDPDHLDCAPNNRDVMSPRDNLNLNRSITLCGGTYMIRDYSPTGIIRIVNNNSITLTCNNTWLNAGTLYTGGTAIYVDKTVNVTVQNCNMSRYSTMLEPLNSKDLKVYNNTFTNNTGHTFDAYEINDSIFSGNRFLDSLDQDISMYLTNVRNTTILNNTFLDNYKPILLYAPAISQGTKIINNNFIRSQYVAIDFDCYNSGRFNCNDTLVDHNLFQDTEPYYAAIYLLGVARTNITNNVFRNNSGALYIEERSRDIYVHHNYFFNNSMINYWDESGEVLVFGSSDLHFNITVAGKAQGNYWSDIDAKGLRIYDTDGDLYADSGEDYPYNSTNGGNVSVNVTDWGPMLLDSDGDFDPDNSDCAPNNPDVLTPYFGIPIKRSITLCNGTYNLTSTSGPSTAIQISNNSVILTCNNTRIVGDGTDYGISATYMQNITVVNCTIEKFNRGIYLSYVNSSSLLNNNITNLANAAIQLDNLNHSSIIGNQIHEAGASSYGIWISSSYNVTMANNTLKNNYQSLYINSGEDLKIINNLFTNSTDYSIYIYSLNSSSINNNLFENNTDSAGVSAAIAFVGTGIRNINVTNNTFRNNRGAVRIYSSGTGNLFYHNNFINNTFPTLFGTFAGLSAQVATRARAEYNHFNTTVGGAAQGNYWSDIYLNKLHLGDLNGDGFADMGTNYPYRSTTGGNVSTNVTDWGPMTSDADSDGDPDWTDCAPNDPNVMSPYNGLIVNRNIILCNGTYNLADPEFDGVVRFNSTNHVTLTCNMTILKGMDHNNHRAIRVENRTNVTVKDCIIRDYAWGIEVIGVNDSYFLNNSLYNDTTAFGLLGVNRSIIRDNNITFSIEGFYLSGALNNTISKNIFKDTSSGIDFAGETLFNNRVINNTFQNNTYSVRFISSSNNGTLISGNTFANSTLYSVYGAANEVNFTGNRFISAPVGLLFETGSARNYINYNNFSNVTVGIDLQLASNTTVSYNFINGSRFDIITDQYVNFNNSMYLNHMYGGGVNDTTHNNTYCVNVASVDEGNFYINHTNSTRRGWNDCGPAVITSPVSGSGYDKLLNIVWKKQSSYLPIMYNLQLMNRTEGKPFATINYTSLISVTWNTSNFTEGNYSLRVIPYDTVVNGTYSAEVNFTISHSPPTTTDNVTTPVTFWYNDANISILLHAVDPLGVNFTYYCVQSMYEMFACPDNYFNNTIQGNLDSVVNVTCADYDTNGINQLYLQYYSANNLGVQESTKSSSQFNLACGVYVNNSFIFNSTVINNATVKNSNISQSTIDGCYVENSNITNSIIRYDSTYKTPCIIINSTVADSTVTSAKVFKTFVDPSNITDSTIIDSNITDATVEFSIIKNTSFCTGGFYVFGAVMLDDIMSAGQIDYNSRSYFPTIYIDNICTQMPAVAITYPLPGSVVNGTFNITFTTTENRTPQISLDGGAFENTHTNSTHLANTTLLTEGTHTIQIRDSDETGTYYYSNIVSYTVDNSVEAVTILRPLSSSVISGDYKIEALAAEYVTRVEFIVRNTTGAYSPDGNGASYIDTDSADGWSANWSTTLFKEAGYYNITAISYTRCFFVFNCVNATDTETAIRINNYAPVAPTNLIVLDTLYDRDGYVTLNWSSSTSEDTAYYNVYRSVSPNFMISLGTLIKNVTANNTAETLPFGTYRYKVTAVDFAGLESGASNEANTTVDLTGPVGTLSITPSIVKDGSRFFMRYTGTETGLNVTVDTSVVDSNGAAVRLNDSDMNAVYDANHTVSFGNTRGDGNYTLTAVIRDDAGNQLNTSATITLDNSPPTANMTIMGSNGSILAVSRNVLLNLYYNDTNGVTGCRFANDNSSYLVNNSFVDCNSVMPWILSDSEGNKTVFAELTDFAGNTVTINDTIIYSSVQDLTPPSVPTVYDGISGDDLDWWNDNTTLSAHWTTSIDDISITYYKYLIRINSTAGCIPQDCNHTSTGLETSVTRTNLSLFEGTNYSFEVIAYNPWNISAGVSSTDGVLIDLTSPPAPTINSSTHPINVSTASGNARFNWSATDINSSGVMSGVIGYSYTLDTHPGSAPDDTLETDVTETLATAKTDGTVQTLKGNSTGKAYSVYTELEANTSAGDILNVRLQLAEITQDYRENMDVKIFAVRKAESDGPGTFSYNDTTGLMSNIVSLSQDIKYAEDLQDAEYYAADLTLNSTHNGTSDTIYIVVEGWAQDDDNRGNLTLGATDSISQIDNTTKNFVCAEGTACVEHTNDLDFAIEVKRPSTDMKWETSYNDLADGTYYFHAKAKDLAGNYGDTAHYKIIVDTGAVQPRIISPMTGQLFEYSPINVKVDVDQNASVYVVAKHPDGSNYTSASLQFDGTNTFGAVTLEEGTNEIYAVANGTNGRIAVSPSVFIIYGSTLVPSTNKTLVVRYTAGGAATTHMAYAVGGSNAVGIASENDAAVVSGTGSLSVSSDTSTISTKIFVTRPNFGTNSLETDLASDEFMDRTSPTFGFRRKFDQYTIRNELRYPDIYLGGARDMPPGTYNLVLRNNGVSADGRMNITITVR
jgi:parallel beta-helix repeat protein